MTVTAMVYDRKRKIAAIVDGFTRPVLKQNDALRKPSPRLGKPVSRLPRKRPRKTWAYRNVSYSIRGDIVRTRCYSLPR